MIINCYYITVIAAIVCSSYWYSCYCCYKLCVNRWYLTVINFADSLSMTGTHR